MTLVYTGLVKTTASSVYWEEKAGKESHQLLGPEKRYQQETLVNTPGYSRMSIRVFQVLVHITLKKVQNWEEKKKSLKAEMFFKA